MNAPVDPSSEQAQSHNSGQPAVQDMQIPWADLGRLTAILITLGTVLVFSAGKLYPHLSLAWQGRISALEIPFFATVGWAIICFLVVLSLYLYRYLLWDKRDAALDALRERTARKEGAGTLYRNAVERALAVTDRFFGDAGKAEQSWQPRAFGLLREAAPLWTAASYDKCLSIALIYPMFCIFAVWALSGDAGDAGRAVGLINGWDMAHAGRVAMVVAIIGGLVTFVAGSGWVRWAGLSTAAVAAAVAAAVVVTFAFADDFAGADAVAFAAFVALAVASAVAFAVSGDVDGAAAVAFAFPFALAVAVVAEVVAAVDGAGVGAVIVAVAIVGASGGACVVAVAMIYAVEFARVYAERHKRLTLFYWLFMLLFAALCLSVPLALAKTSDWDKFGALLYFLSLLTLINAPFDWAALGITRALLRRGLERGGISPLLCGLADLMISLATIALLGATVIFFTQIFNVMTLLGGAKDVVFDPLTSLQAIADPAQRYAPKYYWLYLMLLTTQLPAILNLAAGFLAVIRTADLGTDLIGRFAARGAATDIGTRLWLAAVQAVQAAIALTLGVIAVGVIYYGIIKFLEPLAGGTMLSWFLSIAEANWPARPFGV